MFIVKVSARPSSIHGIGLFADEKIPKGTMVWKFDPRFDILFDPKDVEMMSEVQRALIVRYAYLSKTTGKYVYSIDDGRFMNHSSRHDNLDDVAFPGEPETCTVANRDIEAGEELLINYRSFDAHDATSDEAYLDS